VQQHRRTDADGRSRNGGHHKLRRGRERFQVTDGGRHLPRLGGKVRQIIPLVKQSGAPAISRNADGGIAIRVRQCLGQPVYTWRGRSSSPAGSGESRESGLDVNYNMIGHESSRIVREDETKQPQEFLHPYLYLACMACCNQGGFFKDTKSLHAKFQKSAIRWSFCLGCLIAESIHRCCITRG